VPVVNHTPAMVQLGCTDPDGGPAALALAKVRDPAHGTLGTISASGRVTYTPDRNYSGSDTFEVKAGDGRHESAVRTIRLVVAANRAPACEDRAVAVAHATPATIELRCADPEGDALTLSRAGGAAAGISGTIASYVPGTGFHGTEVFTYVADDGHGGRSAPATVTLSVAAPPPVENPGARSPEREFSAPTPAPDDARVRLAGALRRLTARLASAQGKLDRRKPMLHLGTLGPADCPSGCTFTGVLRKGKAKLGTATITVRTGRTARVRIRLTASAAKRLARGKTVSATLALTLRDGKTGAVERGSRAAKLRIAKPRA
jgi:hypothetical protein